MNKIGEYIKVERKIGLPQEAAQCVRSFLNYGGRDPAELVKRAKY